MKRRLPLAKFIDVPSKNVLVARREHIEQHEENTLLGNTSDLLPVRVEDVPAMAGERDATVLENELRDRQDDGVDVRVLEHEVVECAVSLLVNDSTLSFVRNKRSICTFVLKALPLSLTLADRMRRERLFAVGNVGLRA